MQVFLTGDPVAAGPGSEVLTVRATQVTSTAVFTHITDIGAQYDNPDRSAVTSLTVSLPGRETPRSRDLPAMSSSQIYIGVRACVSAL